MQTNPQTSIHFSLISSSVFFYCSRSNFRMASSCSTPAWTGPVWRSSDHWTWVRHESLTAGEEKTSLPLAATAAASMVSKRLSGCAFQTPRVAAAAWMEPSRCCRRSCHSGGV